MFDFEIPFEVKSKILDYIHEIEQKYDVEILLAVESGSRAWGFPSPDSDYDVRFIYAHKKDYYLDLESKRDVIEYKLDDVYDINGWDVQKALRLMHNSNPTIFEWLKSPIVYYKQDSADTIRRLMQYYFNNKKAIYHYLNMAKATYKSYLLKDAVKLKKYFYVLRPLLCCEHIIRTQSPPPMEFDQLLDYVHDDNVLKEIENLLTIKTHTSELGTGEPNEILHRYIEEKITEYEDKLNTIIARNTNEWRPANDAFKDIIDICS